MADFLSSTYIAASLVSRDDAARTITITGHHNVTGAVSDMAEYAGYTFIYSGSSGRLSFGTQGSGNSKTSATGVIGTDAGTIKFVETANSYAWGGDNFRSSNSGAVSRIYGDSSVTAEFRNIQWISNASSRSDWDVHRGSSANGSSGPACTFNGLYVETRGTTVWNHIITSQNLKIIRNSYLDYGLAVRNTTNAAIFEVSCSLNQTPDGLIALDTEGKSGQGSARTGEQVVFLYGPSNSQAFTQEIVIKGLSCRSIGTENGTGTRTLKLIDPQVTNASNVPSPGIPPRSNAGRRKASVKVYRTQRVNYTGADLPDGTTIYADTTSTNSLAENATATTSGNAVDLELLTHNIATNETQTALGTYRITTNAFACRKNITNITTALGTGAATALSATLTPQAFPNGDAVTERTGTAAVANLDDLYKVLQKHEIDNRTEPSATGELTFFDDQGRMKIPEDLQLSYGPSDQSQLIQKQSDQPSSGQTRYRVKCASTLAASSKGITQLYQEDNAFDNTGNVTRQFPERDSNGSSALISYTGDSNNIYIGAYANDGTQLAFAQYAGSAVNFLITAAQASAGNIRFAATRAGYAIATASLDASAGGTFSVALTGGDQELLPTGAVAYNSSATTTGITAAFAVASGNPTLRLEIANVSANVAGAYKIVQDGLITAAGNQFAAFGGKAPIYVQSAFQGDQFFLRDADNKLKRKATAHVNSTFEAEVVPGATALDNANGEVRFKIGASASTLAGAVLNATAADYNTADTIGAAIQSGGGGSDLTAEAVADAVLDEALSGHTTAGTLGKKIGDLSNSVEVASFTNDALDDLNAEAQDGVLSASTSDYTDSGTIGRAIGAANTTTPLTAAETATAVLGATNSSTDTTKAGGQLKAAASYTIPAAGPDANTIATAVKNASLSSVSDGTLGKAVKSAGALTQLTQRAEPPALSEIETAMQTKLDALNDPTKEEIATQVAAPSKTDIATAVKNAVLDADLSDHEDEGSVGAKLGVLENADSFELTEENLTAIAGAVNAPTAAAIATAVAAPNKADIAAAVVKALDLPSEDWVTGGELSTALAGINVSGNVSINTADIERAVAGIEILPGVKLRGALKLALAQLIGGAKLEMRDSGNVNQPAKVPWLVFKDLTGATKIVEVKLGSENGERLLANVLPADINDAPQ